MLWSLEEETGWTPEWAANMNRPTGRGVLKARMEEILVQLNAEPRGWAFREPVNPSDVGDYYDVIKNPMGECTRLSNLLVFSCL